MIKDGYFTCILSLMSLLWHVSNKRNVTPWPISCNWSLLIPSENIRGYQKRSVAWNGLRDLSIYLEHIICESSSNNTSFISVLSFLSNGKFAFYLKRSSCENIETIFFSICGSLNSGILEDGSIIWGIFHCSVWKDAFCVFVVPLTKAFWGTAFYVANSWLQDLERWFFVIEWFQFESFSYYSHCGKQSLNGIWRGWWRRTIWNKNFLFSRHHFNYLE